MNDLICISISLHRTHAVVSINTSEMIVKPVSCTNSKSCFSQDIIQNGCPDVCEIVISAKRYARKRRVKAEVDELNPEKCHEILASSEGIKIDPSDPFKILPSPL